jgi:uncharacterized UPF0146 family protein
VLLDQQSRNARTLKEIKHRASFVTDTGAKKCDNLTEHQRSLFDAADTVSTLAYPPEMINEILDIIC